VLITLREYRKAGDGRNSPLGADPAASKTSVPDEVTNAA